MEHMELNQVTLPCTDLAVSLEFYRRMGFSPIVSSPPDYARFECPGGATFSLHRSGVSPADSGIVIYFEAADLDGTVAALREAGIQFLSGPTDQPWLWREAHLRDPDGNHLCLYHAGKNRRFPPWRLGGGAA